LLLNKKLSFALSAATDRFPRVSGRVKIPSLGVVIVKITAVARHFRLIFLRREPLLVAFDTIEVSITRCSAKLVLTLRSEFQLVPASGINRLLVIS